MLLCKQGRGAAAISTCARECLFQWCTAKGKAAEERLFRQIPFWLYIQQVCSCHHCVWWRAIGRTFISFANISIITHDEPVCNRFLLFLCKFLFKENFYETVQCRYHRRNGYGRSEICHTPLPEAAGK